LDLSRLTSAFDQSKLADVSLFAASGALKFILSLFAVRDLSPSLYLVYSKHTFSTMCRLSNEANILEGNEDMRAFMDKLVTSNVSRYVDLPMIA
jgi:hypothetical protein